jgi:hypothetical protein
VDDYGGGQAKTGKTLTLRAGGGRRIEVRLKPDPTEQPAPHYWRVIELRPGDLFHVPAEPHDSWVLGDEPYVSLHFLGADRYARSPATVA